MSRHPRAGPLRPVAAAAAVVLAANLAFVLLAMVARPPAPVVQQRVAQAFGAGDLVLEDYLPWDARRGWHQYNDCNVLQMLLNPNESRASAALAPVIYKMDADFSVACPVLHGLATGQLDRDRLPSFRYARYWHGYNTVAGFGLRLLRLGDLRRVLAVGFWLAVGALAITAWRRAGRVRLLGAAVALTAAGFWAGPYFAPNLTHGPGDMLVLLSVAGVAAWPAIVERARALAAYAAATGTFTVWLEMLTGHLPIAAAWLAAMALAAAGDRRKRTARTPAGTAVLTLVVFGVASAATVLIKQTLALLIAAPEAGQDFLSQLRQYSAMVQDGGSSAFLLPYLQLARRADVLTYGSEAGAILLALGAGVAWLLVLGRIWRQRSPSGRGELLLLAALAMIPVGWVVLLPHHTYVHAGFMIRIFVVPVALAPVALLWPAAPRAALQGRQRLAEHRGVSNGARL